METIEEIEARLKEVKQNPSADLIEEFVSILRQERQRYASALKTIESALKTIDQYSTIISEQNVTISGQYATISQLRAEITKLRAENPTQTPQAPV